MIGVNNREGFFDSKKTRKVEVEISKESGVASKQEEQKRVEVNEKTGKVFSEQQEMQKLKPEREKRGLENTMDKISVLLSLLSLIVAVGSLVFAVKTFYVTIKIGTEANQISEVTKEWEQKTLPLSYTLKSSEENIYPTSKTTASASNMPGEAIYCETKCILKPETTKVCGEYKGIFISFVEDGKNYCHYYNGEDIEKTTKKGLTQKINGINVEITKEEGELIIKYSSEEKDFFETHLCSYLSLVGYNNSFQNFAVVFGNGEKGCVCIDMKDIYDTVKMENDLATISVSNGDEYAEKIMNDVKILNEYFEVAMAE